MRLGICDWSFAHAEHDTCDRAHRFYVEIYVSYDTSEVGWCTNIMLMCHLVSLTVSRPLSNIACPCAISAIANVRMFKGIYEEYR